MNVILYLILQGRVVFGNRLIPTTLSINIEEAHFVYSTKPAASRLDPYMHFVKCSAENFKASFTVIHFAKYNLKKKNL